MRVAANKRTILLVDADGRLREIETNFLSRFYQVTAVGSGQEALDLLEESDVFDLAMFDIHMAPMNGLELAANVRRSFPMQKIALMSNSAIEEYFPALSKLRIYNVFAKSRPFDFDDFLNTIENMLAPEHAFGLGRYLRSPMELREAPIQTRADKSAIVDEAIAYFRRYRAYDAQVTEIRLAFEELINNALYHGFRRHSGMEKYSAETFTELDDNERIMIEFGRDKHYLGCCVTDNQGVLDVDVAMGKMERQISMEGLLDESGRGIYLTRSLSDRMVINLDPRRITQLILLFAHRPVSQVKPLHINLVGDNT